MQFLLFFRIYLGYISRQNASACLEQVGKNVVRRYRQKKCEEQIKRARECDMKNCKLNPYSIALPFEGSCDRIRFIGFIPVIPEDVVFSYYLQIDQIPCQMFTSCLGWGLKSHCLSHGDDR